LVFLAVSFLLAFPPNNLSAFLSFPMRATYPAHLILLDLIILITFGEEYESRRSSLCRFLYHIVTSPFFGLNILLSTLFSKILSIYFSLNVRDQVLHPNRTRSKTIVTGILIYMFLDSSVVKAAVFYSWRKTGFSSLSLRPDQFHKPSCLISICVCFA
jgi:hypothetical protein